MIRSLALATALAGCALPHVPPFPRTEMSQTDTHVDVFASCGSGSEHWAAGGYASGVIISERHVLTSAHVVRCPGIPTVHVEFRDGTRFRMVVERDDEMFGSGRDVARLEIASAERFGLSIPPPRLAGDDDELYVCLAGTDRCGMRERHTHDNGVDAYIIRIPVFPGDSGTGVYNAAGELAGIVDSQSNLPGISWIERIGPYWLEGT